ncbi:MAG: hypothetical protein Ta2C_10670 [Candidatus Endomicrobiellum trichonymphae]|uniref:hypothetical protein n=1 Tax=Endomicrobium trichonymphae TaxID=1408204 RepID=UPI0027D43F8F|nr:MAG: hypothetical protein Ta2C_10670 [Candidatus Endomicrobium trichonymphae]
MPKKVEDLTEIEIDNIVFDVEKAIANGKIKRVPDEEVMRTRLAALELLQVDQKNGSVIIYYNC